MEISVIVPVYNKHPYLAELLEQIRTQRFGDLECLLIDDGSDDGSGELCDRIARRDGRFRVFHTLNNGVSAARNLGLDQAAGRYITFVDADDRIAPDHLEQLHRCAVESGAALVIGNLRRVWPERWEDIPMPYQGLVSMEGLLPEFARVQRQTGLYGYCAAKLLRRELIGSVRFCPELRLAEDLDFYLELYPRLDLIYFDPTPRYFYLQDAEQSSMQLPDDRMDYLAQLSIQWKLTRFLMGRQAFSGENREIQTARLYDYVYFCLFHGQPEAVPVLCRRIRGMGLPPYRCADGEPVRKRVILWLYGNHGERLLSLLLGAYRVLRKLWRRNR